MKHLILRTAALLALSVIPQALWADTQTDWTFDDDANPALINGSAAAIAPGPFSLGWQEQRPGLDGAAGFWDLGRSGVINCKVAGSAASERSVSVEIWQWVDGRIYNEFAAVDIPGATRLGGVARDANIQLIGGWIVDQTEWNLPAGNDLTVTITGAHDGSLVDRVRVSVIGVVAEPLALRIRPVPGEPGRVELSWSAEHLGASLERNARLDDTQGWAPVSEMPQVQDGRCTVTIEASEAEVFFRLKQQAVQ